MRPLKQLLFFIFIIPLLASPFAAFEGKAQNKIIDSLKHELSKAVTDSMYFVCFFNLGVYYYEEKHLYDSSLYYYQQAYVIAQKNEQRLLEAFTLTKIGLCQWLGAKNMEAFNSLQACFEIAEDPKLSKRNTWSYRQLAPEKLRIITLGWWHLVMGHFQANVMGNLEARSYHFSEAKRFAKQSNDFDLLAPTNGGLVYSLMENKPDSALMLGEEAEQSMMQSGGRFYLPYLYKDLAIAYLKKNNKGMFLHYTQKGIDKAYKNGNTACVVGCYENMITFYLSESNKDSSLYYSKKVWELNPDTADYFVCEALYRSYELWQNKDSINKYLKLTLAARDHEAKDQLRINKEIQRISFEKQLQLQALEKLKIENEGKLKTFSIIALVLVFSTIGLLLYRNNRQKQKANKVLEGTLNNLRSTQAQLIQSEKMASLGELTAGIAHEIQNPLNFVNNFSEVNSELITEMKNEIDKGNLNEVMSIANDINENEQKIILHGKRADAIVKGMLQHSRTSSGQKELTDINELVDKYLRLAYHGLRAKDKSFNAEIKTDFDPTIEKINIVPQDIGRVLLNLINNAFYAVNEKAKQSARDYEPGVTISTRCSRSPGPDSYREGRGEVLIKIRDNGNGISQKVLDKIFQPFFTTKPTGEGTGLGLSLAYDIVKAQGGEIRVETKEGEGSEFIIQLPTTPDI